MLLRRRRCPAAVGDPAAERRERGVALLEAALVTPVFLMLIFGVIEVGLALNDDLALSHATRAGSRVASASGDDVLADYGIVQSIAQESAAIPRDQIELIVVYKANDFGEPPSSTCQGGQPVDDQCNVYTSADFALDEDDFGCDAGEPDASWCPQDRQVVLNGSSEPDYVGVWMKIEHPWVTRMFGQTLTLTDSSVIQLEPRGLS